MAGFVKYIGYVLPVAAALVAGCAHDHAREAAAGNATPREVQGTTPDQATTTPTATGTLSRFVMNTRGEVDGLFLDDDVQVRFPPHMSDELTGATRPGGTVAIVGTRERGGAIRAHTITNTETNQSVTEHEPTGARSPAPAHRVRGAMSAQGRIQILMHNPTGDTDGLVLDDGSIVRFPADLGEQIPLEVFQRGIAIVAQGYGTENRYGRVLEATAMTVAADMGAQAGAPAIGARINEAPR